MADENQTSQNDSNKGPDGHDIASSTPVLNLTDYLKNARQVATGEVNYADRSYAVEGDDHDEGGFTWNALGKFFYDAISGIGNAVGSFVGAVTGGLFGGLFKGFGGGLTTILILVAIAIGVIFGFKVLTKDGK